MDKMMFVIDENWGDYTKAGPFTAIRIDSTDDDHVTLMCEGPDGDTRLVRVTWGFGIFIEDVD